MLENIDIAFTSEFDESLLNRVWTVQEDLPFDGLDGELLRKSDRECG